MQKGHLLPCLPLPTPLLLRDGPSGVEGVTTDLHHKTQALFGVHRMALAYLWSLLVYQQTLIFSLLPMGSRYWKQVVGCLCFEKFPAHWWLQGPQRCCRSFAWWAGPLDLCCASDHGCKLHHMKYFCKLLISVPFWLVCLQDVVRMTETPVGLCQPCPCGRYSLLLGPKLEINFKSGILRLGSILLYITRKLLGFSKHIISLDKYLHFYEKFLISFKIDVLLMILLE